ncbi:hypothetical protein [Caldithrix abyssi]|uniref:Uncharacterized protein n=1 Tax=Caldithrix abyssi DSM 13497 TaxID=880073 RepID=A0A1J1CDX4_CALAY|nr:hypothetical protein [Caldithrix abyssi]APF20766.1 hypothetical protein Cabys_4021 [Caldithrix abyssi DSM 13497]
MHRLIVVKNQENPLILKIKVQKLSPGQQIRNQNQPQRAHSQITPIIAENDFTLKTKAKQTGTIAPLLF